MRRNLAIIGLLFVVLSGCFAVEKKVSDGAPIASEELPTVKYSALLQSSVDAGILSASGPYFILDSKNQKVFIAESPAVNLPRYVGRVVSISGVQNENGLVLVDQISSLSNETRDKKEYLDADFGIKFSYPSLWKLKKTQVGSPSIQITSYEVPDDKLSNVDLISIERTENNRKLGLKAWLGLSNDLKSSKPTDSQAVFQSSFIGAGQIESIKRTSGTSPRDVIEFYVPRDIYIYKFTHLATEENERDMFRTAFFDLVASFEFVPLKPQEPVVASEVSETPIPSFTVEPITEANTLPPQKDLSPPAQPTQNNLQPSASTPTIDSANSDLQKRRTALTSRIVSSINQLAGESGDFKVKRIEYADEGDETVKYIYVVYFDTEVSKRILLKLEDPKDATSNISVLARFEVGTVSDWSLSSGEDPARGKALVVVTLNDGKTSEVAVLAGYRLLEAKKLGVSIQYPKNFYWSYSDNKYLFDSKPIEGGKFLLTLTKGENLGTCVDFDGSKFCLAVLAGRETDAENIDLRAMLETLKKM